MSVWAPSRQERLEGELAGLRQIRRTFLREERQTVRKILEVCAELCKPESEEDTGE